MTKGKGCYLTDVDGHQILDFMNNFTSFIHRHTYPPVVAKVQNQFAKRTAFAAPSEDQITLAELIVDRVSSTGNWEVQTFVVELSYEATVTTPDSFKQPFT